MDNKKHFEALIAIVRGDRPEYFDPAQFLFFCCVGVLNTLLDFAVFLAAGSLLRLPLTAARILSWAAAGAFSYAINKRWVFQHKTGGARPAMRFVLVNLLGLGLGLAALNLLAALGWSRYTAYAATLPVIALGNYLGYKLWSFRDSFN